MISKALFHLSFPSVDIKESVHFYRDVLGCRVGRYNEHSAIIDFGGHQIVAHIASHKSSQVGIYPRHFGLILESLEEWENILERCRANKVRIAVEPKTRFNDKKTSHKTFFIYDPSDNLIEFKYYENPATIIGVSEHLDQIGDSN